MTLQITGNNMNGSPELSLSGGNCNTFAWSPFGGGTGRTTPSLPGFNGERQDPLYGVTHLGNGYRAYSPALRRFTCPDSESPFGVGGINPYVYCDHDPVNRADPSGHGPVIRKSASLGLRLGIASEETADAMATGVATAGVVETGTELATQGATGLSQQVAKARGNVEAARELGWASLGTGQSGGLGLAEGDVGQTVKKLRSVPNWVERMNKPQSMGGNMKDMKFISGDSFYTYEDTYKGERRLNIAGHGDYVDGKSGIVHAGALLDADDVLNLLSAKGVNVQDYSNIRTIVCHSADGGPLSLASELARKTGIPVKGFRGTVTATFTPEMIDVFRNMVNEKFPEDVNRQGAIEDTISYLFGRKSQRVEKTNPYSLFKSPLSYYSFEYSPVIFK